MSLNIEDESMTIKIAVSMNIIKKVLKDETIEIFKNRDIEKLTFLEFYKTVQQFH